MGRIKKFLIVSLFTLLSLNCFSQIKVYFFRDVPPMHVTIILKQLEEAIPTILGDSVIYGGILDMPEDAYCKATKGYNAFKFMNKTNNDSIKTLSITYRSISYACDDEFVDGISFDNASVVSIYYMGTFSRLVKTALHEIGHLYGLLHCKTPGCLMEAGGGADTYELTDREKDFCDKCKLLILYNKQSHE